MDSENVHNDKMLSLEPSIDPFTSLSDLKKMVLLKYSNRDLYLLNLKNDLIKNGRTLFCPYCGGLENLDYLKLRGLDYQNFIFSDSQFKEYSSNEFDGGRKRFVFVDLDPLLLVIMLLEDKMNVKIDCFVGIKDEIHSDDYSFLLEMSIPLFTDSLIYVGSKMNLVGGKFRVIDKYTKILPYKHKLNIDSEYFNFFTDKDLNDIYRIFGSNYDVIHFETKSQKSKVFEINGINIYLVHDSIFQYLSMFDLSFLELSDFQESILNLNYNNVFNVRGNYIRDHDTEFHLFDENDILYLCRFLKAKKVAFTKNWKNPEQIRILTIYPSSVEDIYLLCNDIEDFCELYYQRFDEIDDEF